MTASAANRSIVAAWLGCVLLAVVILVTRLEFSYDLTLFLPDAQNREEAALLTRVADSPGAQLNFLRTTATEADTQALQRALQASGRFSRVLTGPPELTLDAIPQPLWRYRYLLDPQPLSRARLVEALEERRFELSLMAGSDFADLVSADPLLTAPSVLERIVPVNSAEARWQAPDGSRLMLLESNGSAFDIGSAKSDVATIDALVKQHLGDTPDYFLSGVGPFSARLSKTIESESRWRSIAASLAIMLVVFIAYRKFRLVALGALPLASGALAGLVVLTVFYGRVHGITLAFGFTLLGVAIDYPMHLFSRARVRRPGVAIAEIWPTLRLGAISTVIAFLAIGLSGATGPAQLGLFTASGLVVAALVTRFVLPVLMGEDSGEAKGGESVTVITGFSHVPWLVAVVVGGCLLAVSWQGRVFENNLAALSPVPAADIRRDTEARQQLGSVDMRHIVVVNDPDLQRVLEKTEDAVSAMQALVDDGLVAGIWSPADLLPSHRTQRARQGALPAPEQLTQWLTAARSATGFRAGAFESFAQAVAASRDLDVLEPAAFAGSALESMISGALRKTTDGWSSTIALQGVTSAPMLASKLAALSTDAFAVDLRETSNGMVARYRQHTLSVCAMAFVVIAALLLWRLSVVRSIWALATVLSAMFATACVAYVLTGPLSLYHVMALLLVAGLGLDYTLFKSRSDHNAGADDTRHAINACAASTCLAFGILGFSAIPALSAIGLTVATGAALCYLLANFGARKPATGSPLRRKLQAEVSK